MRIRLIMKKFVDILGLFPYSASDFNINLFLLEKQMLMKLIFFILSVLSCCSTKTKSINRSCPFYIILIHYIKLFQL